MEWFTSKQQEGILVAFFSLVTMEIREARVVRGPSSHGSVVHNPSPHLVACLRLQVGELSPAMEPQKLRGE